MCKGAVIFNLLQPVYRTEICRYSLNCPTVVTLLFELYMVPLGLVLLMVGLQLRRTGDRGTRERRYEDDDLECEDEHENIAVKLKQIQDSFPLVQNSLGLLASYFEKLCNIINFSVPFISLMAAAALLAASGLLYLFPLRYLLIILISPKFIKNLITPGCPTNEELLNFLSRVPDNEALEDAREPKRVGE